MTAMDDRRTIVDVVGDLVIQLSALFRSELQLAKAESTAKLVQAGLALGFMAGGAVVVGAALVVLLTAAVHALAAAGIAPMWGALTVGVAALIIGGLVMWKGARDLSASRLKPQETIRQLQQDVAVAKEQLQ